MLLNPIQNVVKPWPSPNSTFQPEKKGYPIIANIENKTSASRTDPPPPAPHDNGTNSSNIDPIIQPIDAGAGPHSSPSRAPPKPSKPLCKGPVALPTTRIISTNPTPAAGRFVIPKFVNVDFSKKKPP